MDFSKFKSGTDIRGIASEGVAGQEINLTNEAVQSIAHGFLLWCENRFDKKSNELKIAIGHDSRISANRIKTALIDIFVKCGVQVFDCSLSSTPAMFMAVLDIPCDCSIEITASHHPFNRNGLKFFTKQGGLDSPDISYILERAQNAQTATECPGGKSINYNYMSIYSEKLCDMIKKGVNSSDYDTPLKGFKIVVDAGNGAGGFYAENVLAKLGADITGSQFLEPDGMFPNHVPNPEDKDAMEAISKATVASKADLGVIFDTDVDRGGAVFPDGEEINRNTLIAIASSIALEGNSGGTIVTDSVTSDGLKNYINTTLGGVHHRFKRGYKNVINEAIRLNNEGVNCPLAIETSGHAAMRENYFLDDGAYLVTKIIIKLANLKKDGKNLQQLVDSLQHAKEEAEIRLPITCEDFKSVGEAVISDLEKFALNNSYDIADDSHEGTRISIKETEGWFLLRLSVHDPIMPINIESAREGGVNQIIKILLNFFEEKNCSDIDTSPLKNHI